MIGAESSQESAGVPATMCGRVRKKANREWLAFMLYVLVVQA